MKSLFAIENINLPEAARVDSAIWEDFQIALLDSTGRFRIDVKSRQIAWSFTTALDAVIDGILNPDTPHVFVSVNLEEAVEKIRYAKAIIEAIEAPVRPALKSATKTSLEFVNGSRLISHPCRPVRGKARTRVYLDEMAHYQHGTDREIYTSALPATTKGDGYIRIGSSPLGARGVFWEIATESMRKWPGYDRQFIPWWATYAVSTDPELAIKLAPNMDTQERVHTFGKPALVEIFENMFLEDFQQEFEVMWVDEATAWISWNLIKGVQNPDLRYWHAEGIDQALQIIPKVRAAIDSGKIESVLCGGVDIGRTRDTTEIIMLGKGTTKQLPVRLMITLDKTTFDDQEACLRAVLTGLPVSKMLIDKTGLGMSLAESMARTGKADGVSFTQPLKELWAVDARICFEKKRIELPVHRDLAYQIHSIKKIVTAAKNNTFDTERNEKHHADMWWALALAIYAAGMKKGVGYA